MGPQAPPGPLRPESLTSDATLCYLWNMVDEFEQFIGGPAKPYRERLHATIGPKRRILINANLYNLWGRPEAAHLFFDRATRRIALRPAPANDNAAFPVRLNRGAFQILAGPFCRHFKIIIGTTHKFVSPRIDSEGRLILDLRSTVRVSRNSRKPDVP
ncbi:MAG TPA: hypothetical protein VFZ49_04605 [Pyrinomonadaceae bacterium]